MLRNSIGYLKETINKISSSSSQAHLTYLNLKLFSDSLSELCHIDRQLLEIDNDYDDYEDAYKSIELSKQKNMPNNLIFLALVSFHQKKGSVVECTLPKREDLEKNNVLKTLINQKFSSVKSIIDDLFVQIPIYALTDGIHLVNKDTQFFFIFNYKKPLYCLSHYVQIKTQADKLNDSNVIDDFQKNERNCIQKALCIVSTIPLFGNSIIYQNFYSHLISQMDTFMSQKSLNDKTNLDILYNNITNIKDMDKNKWIFNLRKMYCFLKEDIFILIKLILLEKRIIVYSQIPSNVSMFIIALMSLIPGEISQGLLKSYSQNGMPFRIFHDKYLIYPLFSLFDLDPLLLKIKNNNKNINFIIGTTNKMVSNSNKIIYSCKIDLDKAEVNFNSKMTSENVTSINDVEENNNLLISNFISKNIKNEGGVYIPNKKYCVKGEWIVPVDNEIYLEENKFIKKIINNYIFSIIADISYISKEIKNMDKIKSDFINLDNNNFPLYDMINDNYNKYMNNNSDSKENITNQNINKKFDKLPSIEEISSDPLYTTVNTILNYNSINSAVIPESSKYKDVKSLISKQNNLEFLVDWLQTKNFKKWFCSYDEILTNLSVLNHEKVNIKIYDFDNNFYSGNLKNGKKIGKGKVLYHDKNLTYIGEFNNGLKEGKGNLSSKDSKFLYEGSWKNDKYDGEGSLLSPELGKYIGSFKNGLFDGQGYLITPDKNTYKGSFLCGEKNGEGEYKLNDGHVYIGGFKNDLYHGNGKLYDDKKNIIQEGKFQKGQFIKSTK